MAALIVNRGLQQIGRRASAVSGTFNTIQTISADDSTVAFAAGDTALNSGGAVGNEADRPFDATPTASGQVVTHVATFGLGEGNFTMKRFALHNDTSTNVTSSSATLIGGIDGFSITKTSGFTLTVTMTITYTDNS